MLKKSHLNTKNTSTEAPAKITGKRLTALLDMGRLLTGEIELDNLLKLIIEKTSEIMDAERSTIYIVDESSNELWFKIAQEESRMQEVRLKIGTGVAGYVAETGEIINVAEPYEDPRFYKEIDKITGFKTDSILTIPLTDTKEKVIGVLQVLNKRTGKFDADDEEFLLAIGAYAAVAISNAQIHGRVKNENILLKKELSSVHQFDSIIGKSKGMQSVFDLINKVCNTDVTILVNGESGTGKELVARSIHYNSPRKHEKFMAINCGSLPESLLESELFGHIKGSFTGATGNKPGLFLMANGGTLFLDEIGDTTPGFQVKLLRVLEERKVRPVGSTDDIDIDIRIVAATNKNLVQAIAAKEFREDLFYRLNVINILIPPLRDRKEDIPLLVHHYLSSYKAQKRTDITHISPDTMQILMDYAWPGNVRELVNVIERGIVLTEGDTLKPDSLPPNLYHKNDSISTVFSGDLNFKEAKARFEQGYFTALIRKHNGNISKAALEAGIDRRNVHVKIKRYNIDIQNIREGEN